MTPGQGSAQLRDIDVLVATYPKTGKYTFVKTVNRRIMFTELRIVCFYLWSLFCFCYDCQVPLISLALGRI